MVRRGSTVRVRQRALAKGPQTRGFQLPSPLHLFQRDQVWNTFWNTQTKNDAVLSSFLTTNERPPTWVKTESTVRVVTGGGGSVGRETPKSVAPPLA
jgi:hypothetical protein